MKTIVLSNAKGGVGKTSLATHVAAGLALRGQRVMLIDADAQGHATTSFKLKKEPGLYDLLVRDLDFEDVLRMPPLDTFSPEGAAITGTLYVLPSNLETRLIPMALEDALALRRKLVEVERLFDVVIIDTSPTPSLLHSVTYFASNYILYPTECENLSLDGLAETMRNLSSQNEERQRLHLGHIDCLGIQPTMYRVNTNGHDYGLSLLTKQFKRLVYPAIPQRTVWVERAWAQQMLFAYAPDSDATVETWALIDRVQKGMAAAS